MMSLLYRRMARRQDIPFFFNVGPRAVLSGGQIFVYYHSNGHVLSYEPGAMFWRGFPKLRCSAPRRALAICAADTGTTTP